MSEGRANADGQGDEGTSEDADQSVEMLKDLRALYPSVGGLIEQGVFQGCTGNDLCIHPKRQTNISTNNSHGSR